MEDWGQFIGFIFVALISFVSWIAKARENRNEEAKRAQRKAQRTSAKDMPEATRRMLYGDKGKAPQRGEVQVRTAEPKRVQPTETPRHAPTPTTIPLAPAKPFLQGQPTGSSAPPPVPRQHQAQPVRHYKQQTVTRTTRKVDADLHPREVLEQLWQQAMEQKKQQQQRQQPRRQRPPQRQQQQHEEARPEHRHERDARLKKAALAKQHALSDAKQQAELAQRQKAAREQGHVYRPKPTAAQSLVSILNNPADLRKGILLQEILGTPKGLQEL